MTNDMIARSGYAWLLLPLLFVVGAFLYTGGAFGAYFWGYLGLMFLWAFVFTLGFGLVNILVPKQRPSQAQIKSSGIRWDLALLLLGALAVFALFYDRYFLRDIDYFSVGVAKGRALLNQGEHESSFFSILGNFFLYSYLFPLIRLILLWEDRKLRTHFFVVVVVLVELAGVSYLMGGRTAILLTIAVCLGSFVARCFLGKAYRPAFFSIAKLLMAAGTAVVAFGMFFWFRSRAFGEGDSLAYFLNICGHLTTGTYLECDFGAHSGSSKDLLNYLHLVLLYGVHGTWLAEEIVQSNWMTGWITPQGLYSVFLSRLGVEAPPPAFEGFWVPGPASLLNDFGLWGMLCFTISFGAFTGIAVGCLKADRINFATYALIFAVSFWFLSFLIFPLNLPGLLISVWLGVFLWGAHLILMTIYWLVTKRFS